MNGRVLIVHPSLTIRMDLAEAFETHGIESRTCKSAAEARAALEQESFALVLLEALLPDDEAVDLLTALRTDPAFGRTPVMLLSAEPEMRERLHALGADADEYVGTSYDSDFLVARAQSLGRGAALAASNANTLLLIDDSPTFRAQFAEDLAEAGYHVRTAASGEEGLMMAAETVPAAVIVDRQMPGIDGLDVIRRMRRTEQLRLTPCILMTADVDAAAERSALEAGADAILRKGEEFSILLDHLAQAMRRGISAASI